MAIVNQYKFFRSTQDNLEVTGIVPVPGAPGVLPQFAQTNSLSKRYDEPTYMTFRVLFGQNSGVWSGTTLLNTNYDRMPHPLFINQRVDATSRNGQGGRNVVEFNRDVYTTRDYLRDSNEFTREEMLREFITLWEDLQTNFQWYFQSVEGVGELLKPAPERGKRVPDDFRLRFTMAEGIDQRVSYLLNLYRKIAWDDTYQRWVLPDLMRFFDIQILITEFRTFHQSTVEPASDNPVFLQILNGILPTYLVECEMCEFDINSFNFNYKDTLSIADEPEMATVSFDVKVGNVNEVTTYPLFSHFILDDRRINGQERTKEKGLVKDLDGRVTNAFQTDGATEIPIEQDFASTKSGDIRYRNLQEKAQDTFFDEGHVATNPYLESNPVSNIKNSSPNYSIDAATVDPIQPSTWVGNALTFGKAFGVNFVTQKLDQAKMTKVPGLGFSFNDAVAAIESKSFVSVLALVRRSIAESMGTTNEASIDDQIDNTFKEFLTGLSQSEATDGDELELKNMAITVLSDEGKWEEVKDLSYATNLRGPGQKEIGVTIEGGNQYKQMVALTTNNDRSIATDLDGEPNFTNTGNFVGEGTPSSATNVNASELEGRKYSGEGIPSYATQGQVLQPGQILEAQPSSATSGNGVTGDLRTSPILSSGTDAQVTGQGPSTEIQSEGTDGDAVTRGEIKGQGGLGDSVQGGDISGEGGLGSSVEGGTFRGAGGLGSEIESDYQQSDNLSEATDGDRVEDKLDQPNPSRATNNPIDES